jgi:hypothetical protein
MATAAAQARKKAVCRRGVGARGCGPSDRRECRSDRVRGRGAGAGLAAW